MKYNFKLKIMERNGDVIAELNRCNTLNYSLLNNSYNSDKYKMCKDDIVTPLFCSASDCLSKSIIMGSEHKSAERYLSSDDEKINLFSTRRDYVANDDFNMPVIESSVDSINDCCDSPIWEKPPILQSFSPIKVENLKPKNSYINGNKLSVTVNSVDLCKNMSLSNVEDSRVSINANDIDSKLLLDYEASTSSSSSTEELESCPEIKDVQSENNAALIESSEVDSNHNIKNSVSQDFNENIDDLPPSPFAPKLPEIKQSNSNPTSPAKSDRAMPELIPSLICLEDDEEDDHGDIAVPENKKEQYEVINVADSPEMPTLIPFTSERDEIFQVKTECISEDEIIKHDDTDSRDTVDEIFQPQVLLQRLSVSNISQEIEDDKSNVLSAYLDNSYYKHVIEGPEIEEIEGVRFFQFRSKKEMDEFNRRVPKIEADEDMIVPTKTTDITQIKGWRTKFFAHESQFQLLSLESGELKMENSNQEDKVTANHLNETETKTNEKKELHSETPQSETKKSPTLAKCNVEVTSEDKKDHCGDSSSDSEEDEKKTRFKKIKGEGNKNPMSAFVSEELDKYLLNSSTLNISFLQKVNPNITPIAPDAKILSIGKLRKTDNRRFLPHLVFKRKSNLLKIVKVDDDSADPVITLDVPPGSPNVITLESSEENSESSDEDVPVAALKSKKKLPIKRENSKGFKRAVEYEYESNKRVVLRLTKEGSGVSKGYKVSDISCKKNKSASTSRASSPSSSTSSLDLSQDLVEIPANGSLPIIKKTLFSEKKEKRLVNEFLDNLNMYGTRKDVAMLVQSNQSYFDEGPTLTNKICAKAVSVLVSNAEYFEEKQKSKKKLKTWQKYLPKKMDKQDVKMKLSKRKSRIERLLNDAESMIPVERGKRSIRLPARYLDSAVLAASEWVSPVINVDDAPLKPKQEIIEESDKNKVNEISIVVLSSPSSTENSSSSSESSSENAVEKPPIKLPQKRPGKMKKTLAKKTKVKDSPSKFPTKAISKKSVNQINNVQLIKAESSSDSSEEDGVAESTDNKSSVKIVPCKRKKSDVISIKSPDSSSNNIEKSLTDEVSVSKRQRSKKSLVKAMGDKVAHGSFSDASSKDSAKAADATPKLPIKNKIVAPYPRNYVMPDCSCKHSARTTLFEYKSKQFTCAFCNSMKKVIFPANSKKPEPTSLNVLAKDAQGNEFFTVIKKEEEEMQSHQISVNASGKPDSVKMPSEKPEVPGLNAAQKNQLNISDISTSIPISFTNQLLKHDSKIQTVNQNVTPPSSVPSNNVAKYFLLMNPLKTVANTKNVPVLPVRCDLTATVKSNQSPAPASSPAVTNSLLFNNKSKPPILMRKTPTGLLSQNASSPISNSLPAVSCNTNDRTSQGTANTNSKLPVSNYVAAYKVGNYYICNPMVSSAETKTVTPSSALSPAQIKPIEGPVITSVQSVKVDEKNSEDTSLQSENAETTENSGTVVSNHHNYHKKQRHNRRKSPLMQLNYNDDDIVVKKRKEEEESMEVDIETVDDSCNVFLKKKLIKIDESDSDISDDECASIFLSSADKLRSVYSKKTIKERQRRLQIKSGFETLKVSSRWFKNANTWTEILNMAVTVINAQTKSDKMYNLAKKRLKVHNSMLMGKLGRLIDGIEPMNIRNKTKMQIIRALALDQDKYQNKKSVLPLLSEGYKGCAFNSDSERKKLNSNAPDTEIPKITEILYPEMIGQTVSPPPVVEEKAPAISPQPPVEENTFPPVASPQPSITEVRSVQNTEQDDSHSIEAVSLDEVLDLALKPIPDETKKDEEIILKSSEDVNKSPGDSSKKKFEGMKQKVKEALEKNDKEESSDSDTEELGSDSFNLSGFSDDDFDLRICTGDTKDSPNRNKSLADENTDKSPIKEYPGLIPLFHPKVLKKNVSPSQSPLPPKNVGESSHRTNTPSSKSPGNCVAEEIQLDDDDDDDNNDDEVAILNSPTAPSSTADPWGNPSSSKEAVELAVAAKTANKLFGPCKVQKVHLKNGQTVFAYEKDSVPSEAEPSSSSAKSISTNKPPALQTNMNGVQNPYREMFSTIKPKKRHCKTVRKRITIPEEIVLSDSSDEEPGTKNDDSPQDLSISKNEKDIDEQNQGDKKDL